MGLVLIVTGTPGTGKTLIAKKLASILGLRYLNLLDYILERGLAERYDEERKSWEVDTEKVRRFLHSDITTTRNIIVDSLIPDILFNDDVDFVIVLRTDPLVLAKRLIARGWSLEKIIENVEAELIGVCLSEALDWYDEEKVIEIDTTEGTPSDICHDIAGLIRRKVVRRQGWIDWTLKYPDPFELRSLIREVYEESSVISNSSSPS
ncbi:MAG: hypothetical protein DRN15_07010 [Thermoprotei archaeon]|nr:MAG: hypothetical protein DRM97_07045 [Thermoprotei archaeon]RLF23198.1 MAG: hypothetical protein DRN15_07010 [Thermoprotei archaeon]